MTYIFNKKMVDAHMIHMIANLYAMVPCHFGILWLVWTLDRFENQG